MRGMAGELLRNGSVFRVLGWKKGEFCYDPTPAFFDSESELDELVYDGFSSAILSKYLVNATKNTKDTKILVFLRPCDTYGLNLLVKEHRVERERVYAVGVGCAGLLDIDKIKAKPTKKIKNVKSVDENDLDDIVVHTAAGDHTFARRDVLLEKCLYCKGGEFMIQDEILALAPVEPPVREDRFARVGELEAMTPEERFSFWRGELSRCIRCNACRNACPVCSCNTCVFDNPRSGVPSKANSDSFEENMFHIVRAFHVAGHCSDCGECSRVCPQRIPLHLLNRKFIKDINAFYGEFQSGADIDVKSPLTYYRTGDVEPGIVGARGGGA
jgi:ferredoxin